MTFIQIYLCNDWHSWQLFTFSFSHLSEKRKNISLERNRRRAIFKLAKNSKLELYEYYVIIFIWHQNPELNLLRVET